MRILIGFLLALSLGAQTAVFPGAVATDQQLIVARNNIVTTLGYAAGANDTTLTLTSVAGIVPTMLLSVDAEIVQVNSLAGSAVNVTRGFDSTTPAPHTTRAAVVGNMDAWHHNALRVEVEAIEGSLYGAANTSAAAYKFSVTSGAGVSASLGAPGAAVFTFTSCPAGVSGADAGHYLYVSGGAGTAEAVLIAGGTCTPGAPGTIIATVANAHSGAWSIGTATGGIAEALSVSTYIGMGPGTYVIHAPIPAKALDKIAGAGRLATQLQVAADFPLTAPGVFIQDDTNANNGYMTSSQFEDFSLSFIQPDSADVSTYTHWPAAFHFNRVFKPIIRNVTISLAWDGIDVTNSSGLTVEDVQISAYHRSMDIDTTYDTVRLHNVHFWPFGPAITANQINALQVSPLVTGLYAGHIDSLDVSGSVFLTNTSVNLHTGADGGTVFGTFSGDYFDTISQWTMSAGLITAANCWWSTGFGSTVTGGTAANYAIRQTGGRLTIGNSTILANPATVVPVQIAFSGASTTAGLTFIPGFTLTGSNILQGVADVSAIAVSNTSTYAAELALVGNSFFRGGGIAYTNPIIAVVNTTGSIRSRILGNVPSDKGAGAGTFISIAADDHNQVWGNNSVGWANSFPAIKAAGTYQDVNAVSLPATLSIKGLVPAIRTVTATGGIFTSDFTVLCDATAGAVALGLPQASTVAGQTFVFKKIDASTNACTVTPAGADAIDNASSVGITTRYQTASIQSDGVSHWWKWAN